MKRVLVLLCCFALLGMSQMAVAQDHISVFHDDFISPVGQQLVAADSGAWTQSGTSTTLPVMITTPGGLTFSGHIGSGLGNAASLANNGQDVYRSFPSVNSGVVYLSFLMNLSTAGTGDYFIAISQSTSQTNYYARLHVKSSGAGYVVGISKNNEVLGGAAYGSTVLSFSTTYFVVVKYEFLAGTTTDDPISVFVFADGTIPAAEPGTPEVGPYVCATKTDATNFGYVTLRQGGGATPAPTLVIDAIRVATDWGTTYLPIQLASFTCQPVTGNGVELRWSTVSELNNYGFEVQRSASRMDGYESISPLIAGHGTTLEAQSYSYTDNAGFSGAYYRLKQIDLDGTLHYSEPIQATLTTGVASEAKVPMSFGLAQNYPNPFNPSTVVSYQVPASSNVKLTVFNALGQEVSTLVNEVKPAGSYQVQFNAANLPSGLYFYRMQAGNYVETRRMLLLK